MLQESTESDLEAWPTLTDSKSTAFLGLKVYLGISLTLIHGSMVSLC